MTESKRGLLSRCLIIFVTVMTIQETARTQDRGVPELSAPGEAHEPQQGPLRFRSPRPPEFTPEDVSNLAEATQRLREMQNRFLTADLSQEELEALAAQARIFVTTITRLTEKRDAWQTYIEGREPAASMPELVATDLAPAVTDVTGFYRLAKAWMGLCRRHMGLESAGSNPTPPSITEWKQLIEELQSYSRVQMTTFFEGNARYVLRALLLEARCHLTLSTLHFRRGDARSQLDSYMRGLEILEYLANLLRPGTVDQDLEKHEKLPEAPFPHNGCELYGCNDSRFEQGGHQVKTGDKARELLSDYCPWGVQSFLALRAMGLTDGLDWRILLPYGDKDVQYLSEAPFRGAVPAGIQADMDAFRRGRFQHRGKNVSIQWDRPPIVTYSVWYVSPLVETMEFAGLIEWATRVLKVLTGQTMLMLLDEGQDFFIDRLAGEYAPDEPIFAATGTAKDLSNYELIEEMYSARTSGATLFKLATDTMQGVVEYIQRQEIENLFDGINPNDPAVQAPLGGPKTYDGGFMPHVLIRADAMGWEKTSASEYRRRWHYVRNYQYDGRILSGLAPYDLGRHTVSRLPRLPDYLAGIQQVQKDTWKPLGGKIRANDARLYVMDFAPKTQILRLSVPPATLRDWSRGLKENETLVATIMPVGMADSETVMGEMNANTGLQLSYALMAYHTRTDETLMRLIPAAHAWRERLHAQYQVRVLRCARGQMVGGRMTYRLDDPGVVERARFEVRFLSRRGAPATGKRTYELAGRTHPGLVILDQVVQGGAPRLPDPAVSEGPVLKQRLHVSLDDRSGTVTLDKSRDTGNLMATVTPAEPGSHHLTVEAQGRVYHLWCRVDALSSSAIFAASIPVPPGRYDMAVRYGGLTSTITVDRPSQPADTSGAEAQIRRAQDGQAKARSAEQRSLQQALYWDGHRWLAQERHRAGQYGQALEILRQVLKNIPPDQLKGSGLTADKWREVYRAVVKQMVQAALFTADEPTYAQAAPLYLRAWTDHWTGQDARRRPELREAPKQFAAHRADDHAEVIRGAILLGMRREAVEQLLAQYFEWRRKAGVTMPQYDTNQFCYGPENTGP